MPAKIHETDVLVIGGGVNGAAIARDLAGRGLGVMLCEKNDLASATSSASSKMIHGGLRYLEHYAFGLVRESLQEREVMMRAAPHIVWPMSFLLPHHSKLRPWWMIRAGLFLYDLLGGRRSLPRSRGVFLPGTRMGQPLKGHFKRGFVYSDCWVEDSRLVVLNALDAFERGATVMTRTECVELKKHPKAPVWVAYLQPAEGGEPLTVHARMVVNATGPWVTQTLKLTGQNAHKYNIRWDKGSHIIVPRLYQGDHAYLLQNDDGRVIFVFPYERKYSLIGTTDVDYNGDLDEVRVSMEEVEYLCTAVSAYFRQQLRPEDVQWTYSGVRPLVDDGKKDAKETTREYILDIEDHDGLPILSCYGGKITTARKLAEHVADMTVERLGKGTAAWTAGALLPGAEGAGGNFDTFLKTLRREYNWLPEALAQRMARAYGARVREILRGARRLADLGENLGDGIYEAEIAYLVRHEWAETAEDVLWRRSKLGLHVSEETQAAVSAAVRRLRAQGLAA